MVARRGRYRVEIVVRVACSASLEGARTLYTGETLAHTLAEVRAWAQDAMLDGEVADVSHVVDGREYLVRVLTRTGGVVCEARV